MTSVEQLNHEQFCRLMEKACQSEEEALTSFYKSFLNFSFIVPERSQKETLSHSPNYPNDFFNLLGVEDKQRTTIPIFTDQKELLTWFGSELETVSIKGSELINRAPKDWWLIINPSSDLAKEFSPWEIKALKGGDSAVAQVVADQLDSLTRETEHRALNDNEFLKLKGILINYAASHSEISTMWLTVEKQKDSSGTDSERLLIGVALNQGTGEVKAHELREEIHSLAQRELIGISEPTVILGFDNEALALGPLKISKPIFERHSKNGLLNLPFIIFAALLGTYCWFLFKNLKPFWFNARWTTDDALQQVYPFHEALIPDLFKGDLITSVMKGYLAPLHYWLSYGITLMTGNPVMMSHWVMLIQISLTVLFIFLAVKKLVGIAPSLFAVTWFLHTRPVFQRMTGGLPRGWSATVLAAYLYFILSGNHTGVLVTLLAGCLLHPPATFTAAVAYGLFLLWKLLISKDFSYRKPFLRLLIASPFLLIITLFVIHRPASIGAMVDYATAASMPEFQWPHGRFPFVPIPPVWTEFQNYAFQPFLSRLFDPGDLLSVAIPVFVSAFILWAIFNTLRQKRELIPNALIAFFIATLISYFAARVFAFKLYVPNRHLQFPMSIFIIEAVTIAAWKLGSGVKNRTVTFIALGVLIYITSGSGLAGSANFNFWAFKKGNAFEWISNNTPQNALIAGHPTHINAVPLFGKRIAFATTETAHPFYPIYYAEIKRRLIISLEAHYATDLKEFYKLLAPEHIDYFIFSRKRFYPEALKKEKFFSPLNELIKKLTEHNPTDFVYKELPRNIDPKKDPFVVFIDNQSLIIDVNALGKYLKSK